MKRLNSMLFIVFALTFFGVVITTHFVVQLKFTDLRDKEIKVGACRNIGEDVSPVCAVEASSSGCKTKYEKKAVQVAIEGGGFKIEYQDDLTKPIGCESSPVDYHGRCLNSASTVDAKTLKEVNYESNYREGPNQACVNTRTVYTCVAKPVNTLLPLGAKHCVGEEEDQETCPGTYPTVEPGNC
ncbi:MAG: hypothetical protein LBE12_02795 [Planctomycetaceae bacterium]|jgi:hypothetical protein|nr:hypothetical protein [Planctomycetaceae bacterium]